MSILVAFRARVAEWVKSTCPDIRDIDFYDGVFDEKDIKDWSIKTSAARVAIMKAPTQPDTTGNLVAECRVYVVVIVQDKVKGRDSDPRCWELVERIATAAKDSDFGDVNAGRAADIDFSRIGHAELRREGIAVGVTEWKTLLNVGTNKVLEREFIRDDAGLPIPLPPDLMARTVASRGPLSSAEYLGITDPADG